MAQEIHVGGIEAGGARAPSVGGGVAASETFGTRRLGRIRDMITGAITPRRGENRFEAICRLLGEAGYTVYHEEVHPDFAEAALKPPVAPAKVREG